MAIVRPNPKMDALVKDSGVLLQNFKEIYDEAEDYEDFIEKYLEAMDTDMYLGITRGGTNSSMENENRIVEYDGRRVRSVGDFSVDSATPQIVTKLLLHTVENIQRALPMSDVTTDDSGKQVIKSRLGTPKPEDYMESLSWVREMGNGDIKIVTLYNAINISNGAESGADKSESELDVTFIGTAKDWKDTKYAPVEIVLWPRTV